MRVRKAMGDAHGEDRHMEQEIGEPAAAEPVRFGCLSNCPANGGENGTEPLTCIAERSEARQGGNSIEAMSLTDPRPEKGDETGDNRGSAPGKGKEVSAGSGDVGTVIADGQELSIAMTSPEPTPAVTNMGTFDTGVADKHTMRWIEGTRMKSVTPLEVTSDEVNNEHEKAISHNCVQNGGDIGDRRMLVPRLEVVNAPAWEKKHRGAMPDARAMSADRVTALEIALRGFVERKTEEIVSPADGTVFDSISEAYDFYNLYSWERGFGIRYGKSRVNSKGGRCMQEIVCSCSGKLRKQNSGSCHTECNALIRLLRTDDNRWYICIHRAEHNHELLKTCTEKVHFQSHRHIDQYTKELVSKLRANNVNLSRVYSIIGSVFGRMDNVPFSKRCLRTLCGQINREQADDDVRKTMQEFTE